MLSYYFYFRTVGIAATSIVAAPLLALGLSCNHVAWSQEEKGVKIELKLTPSAPESVPEKASDNSTEKATAQADKAKTGNAKPVEVAIKKVDEPASNSEKPRKNIENVFRLSAFRLPQESDVKEGAKAGAKAVDTKQYDGRKLELGTDDKSKSAESASKMPSSRKDAANSLQLEEPPSPSRKAMTEPKAKLDVPKLPELIKESGVPSKPLKTKPRKDESDNEDAECPGGVEGGDSLKKLPDDIPLEQQDHPYDAPAAESSSNKPDRPTAGNAAPLTAEQLSLRNEINQLLRYYIQHPETTTRRSPWAVMHAILPYGVEAELLAGNRRVNAIGWMSHNGLCKTQRIFQPTKSGFRTNLGPGVQGHEGQFLAILAQSKVAPNYPLKVGNRNYTVNDLVRYEMVTCREKTELTFKLLGLSYYLEQNQRWRDNQGGTWTLEKLVAEELDQPIVGAACGGTHRLMGLTFSLLQRKQSGLPIDGHWSRSEQFLNDFVAYAFSMQNPDGSFSTEWFEGRANDPNIERKVQTTGHILEWLVYTVPDEQLQSPQVLKAVRFLLNTIGAEPGRDWPIGPRGHSLRALALYNQRVFGAQPGKLKQYIANLNNETKQR